MAILAPVLKKIGPSIFVQRQTCLSNNYKTGIEMIQYFQGHQFEGLHQILRVITGKRACVIPTPAFQKYVLCCTRRHGYGIFWLT